MFCNPLDFEWEEHSMLTLTEVGQVGQDYIKQKIKDGIGSVPFLSVANAVLLSDVMSSGHNYAIAEATSDCDINNFESWHGNGGKDTKVLLSKWIWDFINANPSHVCLIDEQESMLIDPSWQRDVYPSFSSAVKFFNKSIFYCLSSATVDEGKVSELISTTFWYPFYCAFVVDNEGIFSNTLVPHEITEEQLSRVVKCTHSFVTDAYDLEGLLFWARQQAPDLNRPF